MAQESDQEEHAPRPTPPSSVAAHRFPEGSGSAVVLSGSIGRGHDSVAEVCGAALRAGGITARTLDCMALLGSVGARAGTALFRRMLSIPTVYDGFHFSHLRTGTWLPRAMTEASSRRMLPALLEEVGPFDGPTLLLPVFPTGVAVAARLKAERREVTAVTVCTDACAHRMWVREGIDLYVVCSALAAATVRRYDPGAAIATLPPPVRPAFFAPPDRSVARRSLEVPLGAPCVVVMAGGWGLAPLAGTVRALARAGYWVLAVAGGNVRLHERLMALSATFPQVRAFGMTDRVPELMAAADTVVTSPGQTCHEARVVGRRLVVLDVVPGHGRENTIHELENGGALACSPDPASVLGVVQATFADQPEPEPWPLSSAGEWDKLFLAALSEVGVPVSSA